jgi:hypothetical protein
MTESNHWTYKGSTVRCEDDIPQPNAIGFVYMITQHSTGRRYIGRKLLTKSKTITRKGEKKRVRVSSDWLDYWSSSPKIIQWIDEAGGTKDFSRQILTFVSSKGMLAYAEEAALYIVGALESDAWINDNIRSKIYRSWCKPLEAKVLRMALKEVVVDELEERAYNETH